MQQDNIYIIGFPKSGNTWLSRLIAEVTKSKIYVSSENDVVNNSENTLEKNGTYLINKIHYVEDINSVMKAKKIYIVRDPRDVFISGFYHSHRRFNNLSPNSSIFLKWLFNRELKKLNKCWSGNIKHRFIARIKGSIKVLLGLNITPQVGGWSQHVTYWSNVKDTVVIKYEDLLENPFHVLTSALNDLNIDSSEEQVLSAIEAQNFDKKKEQFILNGDLENAKFMRSGTKAKWKEYLNDEQSNYIVNTHSSMMKKLGYID